MTVVFGDVKIIHLPGALVVGQVSPLDQVMHIAILIKTARKNIQNRELTGLLEGLYTLPKDIFRC